MLTEPIKLVILSATAKKHRSSEIDRSPNTNKLGGAEQTTSPTMGVRHRNRHKRDGCQYLTPVKDMILINSTVGMMQLRFH